MRATLALTGPQHQALRAHLFPGDGLEAVALVLCGRGSSPGQSRFAAHQIVPMPYGECRRTADRVTWPTERLEALLDRAARDGLAVGKVHGHPGGQLGFSEVDDEADADLFGSVQAWVDDGRPHLSAVMVPDGAIVARAHGPCGHYGTLDHVMVVGENLQVWRRPDRDLGAVPGFALRHAQAFGRRTFDAMRGLRIGVIGCSGTGSVVVDQLARLGVGQLVLVDPDAVEDKNLNRIVNTIAADVGRAKVRVLADFVARLGLGTTVEAFEANLATPEALRAASTCDVVFGCMDGVEGRDLLNRLAAYYSIPYFDVGVRLDADGAGGIDQICGSAHYLRPGGSSLRSRGLYADESLEAESLRRQDPSAYADRVARGYLRGVDDDRPAVNAVNGLFSSLAVTDFLLRLHPSRLDPNDAFAVQTLSLTGGFLLNGAEGDTDAHLARHVGRGDAVPFLGRPHLDMLMRAAA